MIKLAVLILTGILATSSFGYVVDDIGVLVFSKTAGFRHAEAIDAAKEVLAKMAADEGWRISFTENAGQFTRENLAKYDVVIFNNTTQNVLPEQSQRNALKSHIRSGGGYVGIHAASDTLYEWEWYGKLVGAYFQGHPPGMQLATIKVEDPDHPTMEGLGESFEFRDEWYWFRANPREHVHVLATLDRTSHQELVNYDANSTADHPIIWANEFDGGRAWYTAFGHNREPVIDERFVKMLHRAIIWVADK